MLAERERERERERCLVRRSLNENVMDFPANYVSVVFFFLFFGGELYQA